MVRRGTGLHTDQARRQGLKKCHHLAAPELLPDNDLLVGVDAVDLEHVLGDIQIDRGNLHLDGSPHVIRHNDHSMALRCRERAPSTTSNAEVRPCPEFPTKISIPSRNAARLSRAASGTCRKSLWGNG